MASSLEFIEFICEQIDSKSNVRFKKMFGEYMIYINEKPLLLVCDNTVFVKKLEEIEKVLKNINIKVPYKGAKEHFVIDVEDRETLNEVIKILDNLMPLKKKKHSAN